MKLFCAPPTYPFIESDALNVVLFGQPGNAGSDRALRGSAGESAAHRFRGKGLQPTQRAWDFLSIALAVVVADNAVHRSKAPDGWTRAIDLTVAVDDPDFWKSQSRGIEAALKFLSTDLWNIEFVGGGHHPYAPNKLERPDEEGVVLLSGGLDSLVGAIDLAAQGKRVVAVSKTDIGDAANQRAFANAIGGGLYHLALNHNAKPPWEHETSQRARSIGFIAFAAAAASALERHRSGEIVPLYICENGFIALNPPLTPLRLGSLSTRTAHPEFLARLQQVFDAAEMRVQLLTPYAHATKGEMLQRCADQPLLLRLAAQSVSCGRYRRNGFQHCGRCVPCQVRRASFLQWGVADTTSYTYGNLGRMDSDHAHFDDVRSVAMAVQAAADDGFDAWLGGSLSYPNVVDRSPLKAVAQRGLAELDRLQKHLGVS